MQSERKKNKQEKLFSDQLAVSEATGEIDNVGGEGDLNVDCKFDSLYGIFCCIFFFGHIKLRCLPKVSCLRTMEVD